LKNFNVCRATVAAAAEDSRAPAKPKLSNNQPPNCPPVEKTHINNRFSLATNEKSRDPL
jgi:hypothetical protein